MKRFLSGFVLLIFLWVAPAFANEPTIPVMDYSWEKINLKVYIEDTEYKNTAQKAFKDWRKSSYRFDFVKNPYASDINVFFVDKTFDNKQKIGAIAEIYRDGVNILHANIYVPQNSDKNMLEKIIMHEIGHALGVVKHTEDGIMSTKPITDDLIIREEDYEIIKSNEIGLNEKDSNLSVYADACKKAHKYEEAIDVYKQILEKSPDFAPAIYSTGFCYYQLKNYATAAEYIEKAYVIKPDNPFYMNGYARILLKINKNEQAKFVFNNFIKANPQMKNHFAVKQVSEILKR